MGTLWGAEGIWALRSARFATDRFIDEFTANGAKRRWGTEELACIGFGFVMGIAKDDKNKNSREKAHVLDSG